MSFITPATFATSTAYSIGSQVLFNGVVYEATIAILASNTTDPSQSDDWKVVSVRELVDYNAIVEAVRLQLNVRDNQEINDSVPLFMQLTEDSIKMRIRAPALIARRVLTVDTEGRVTPPSDLLEIISVRFNGTDSSNTGAFAEDVIEILNANYEEYQRVLRADREQHRDRLSFDSAVYWFDSRYLFFAPAYTAGSEIEITYYKREPRLGEVVNITDFDGNELNSAGQTEAQWIAASTSNTAANFVVDTQVTTSNWFSDTAPQMLLYGACLRARTYLRDDDSRLKQWAELYVQAEKELQDLIDSFEDRQAHSLYIQNTYADKIY